MVLLTGAQVSLALSSAIVAVCTIALFLAGYILQQQTVRTLKEGIVLPEPLILTSSSTTSDLVAVPTTIGLPSVDEVVEYATFDEQAILSDYRLKAAESEEAVWLEYALKNDEHTGARKGFKDIE